MPAEADDDQILVDGDVTLVKRDQILVERDVRLVAGEVMCVASDGLLVERDPPRVGHFFIAAYFGPWRWSRLIVKRFLTQREFATMGKQLFSTLAIALTFVAFLPYIRSIRRGDTKPHVFSWVIWGLTTFIVFFAQLAGRGGLGAWPIGVSGAITIYVALIAYLKRSDSLISKTDWVFFFAALSALPFWFLTSDPMWAVVTLTVVDVLGFGPTVRRACSHPHEESIGFFTMFAARNLLVILALEHYSLTTVLFPAVVGFACLLVVLLIAYRRFLLTGSAAVGSRETQ